MEQAEGSRHKAAAGTVVNRVLTSYAIKLRVVRGLFKINKAIKIQSQGKRWETMTMQEAQEYGPGEHCENVAKQRVWQIIQYEAK